MSKVPNVSYDKVIRALKRNGWVVVMKKCDGILFTIYTKWPSKKMSTEATE